MENPFPGVNPYIESQGFWRDFHTVFVASLRSALNRVLPDGLAAFAEERIYIKDTTRFFEPDVVVLPGDEGKTTVSRGLAEPVFDKNPLPVIVPFARERITERYVNIVSARQPEQIIATLEVLSPTNKTRGDGREEYIRKQRTLLNSGIHLIEIDLLRGGEHTVAVPETELRGLYPQGWDFLVSVHRAHRWEAEAWPLSVRESLPTIFIPLQETTERIFLDLALIYDDVWRGGRYGSFLDYETPISLPFAAETQAWIGSLLEDKGLR